MVNPRVGSTGAIESKGDLLAFDGTDLTRLPVGPDGHVLRALAASASGLEWKNPDDIPGIGYPISFGSAFSAAQAGRYHRWQAPPDSTSNAALTATTQASIIKSGIISRLAWNTVNATATTVYKIWVNGIVVATVPLTGVKGAVLVSSPPSVLAGDLVAIEYDAGAAPGSSGVQIFVE